MSHINSGRATEKCGLLVTILAIRPIHRWSHKQFQCVSQTRQLGSLEIREKKLEVGLSVELSAAVHRDLVAYGQALARETGQGSIEPAKLIAPMLARFMTTDRVFA